MKYIYLISNFVALIPLLFFWRGKWQIIRRYRVVLGITCLIGFMNTIAEGPAMRWGVWFYNNPKTLGITLWGAKLETYLYCILVPLAIGSAAIIFAERSDHGKK